ncbi:MAG: hypothetical protein ACRDHE_03215 [Ktedonobacterales bacterium]
MRPTKLEHPDDNRGGKKRGHGRLRQTAVDDLVSVSASASGLWKRIANWGRVTGIVGVLVVVVWYGWTYVPTLRQRSLSIMLSPENISVLQSHPELAQTTVGGNSVLIESVTQPIDSQYSPEAADASPPGWFGQASCILSSRNVLDKTVFEFGVKVDFVRQGDTLHIWIPPAPVASGNFGWAAHAVGAQQVYINTNMDTALIAASGDADLAHQSGGDVSSYLFTVVLVITASGAVACELITASAQSSLPPNSAYPSDQAGWYLIIRSVVTP